MNATTACHCIITLSLVSVGLPSSITATAAVGSGDQASASSTTPEVRKPGAPGTTNPPGTARGTTPAGKTREAPMPPNRVQEVEERVRSGQMDQPIAQGEISERLNQLGSGSKSPSPTGHSNR
jgi:hypothetical protein